jgi:hypothetical protein
MKIVYTDSGKAALEVFKGQKVKELEEAIISKKYVFGDDEVEITAADVKAAAQSRRIDSRRKMRSAELGMQLYLVIGVLMTVWGLFYDRLQALFHDKPASAMLVVGGVFVTVVSFLMRFWLRVRYQPETLLMSEAIKKINADTIMDARAHKEGKSEE